MQDPSGELTITGVVQREAWLQRAMPPAEQLGEDLWSLPVPIPDNPLRYVSVYAFGTGEGLVLIDAGWGAEESWRALRDGLESIGAGVADVRGVLVTHMHFDHVGLAGRVRQASGAWIAMHPADQAVFARSDYRSAERAVAVEAEFLRGLGASPAEAAAAVGTAEQWEKFTTIALPDRLLTDGELADVPGWKLRAVHTPATPPGTCVSWTSGRAGCSPAITCCPGSPPTSPSSAALLPTRSGITWTRWPGRGTWTWTRCCPRTSGGSAACPGGSTPSRPTTSDGSPNCWTRSAGVPAPPPGSWPGS